MPLTVSWTAPNQSGSYQGVGLPSPYGYSFSGTGAYLFTPLATGFNIKCPIIASGHTQAYCNYSGGDGNMDAAFGYCFIYNYQDFKNNPMYRVEDFTNLQIGAGNYGGYGGWEMNGGSYSYYSISGNLTIDKIGTTVTMNNGNGTVGSLSTNGNLWLDVLQNTDIVIMANSGKAIGTLTIDGNVIPLSNSQMLSYTHTFTNVTTCHSINVAWIDGFPVTTAKTGNGTISPGKCSEPGTDYDVAITPDPNHYIKSLFINGTEVTVSSKDKRGLTYHLTNIQESYDFQVEFAQGFKIISNICTGGSIVPNYKKCMVGELV